MLIKMLRADLSNKKARETAVKVMNQHVVPVFRKLDGFGDATVIDLGDTELLAIFTYQDDAMDAAENEESILSDALTKGLFHYGVSVPAEDNKMIERTYPAL